MGTTLDPSLKDKLSAVRFEGLPKSIVALEMVLSASLKDGVAKVELELPSPAHPGADALAEAVNTALRELPEVKNVEIRLSWRTRAGESGKAAIGRVKNVVAVASGKGGVGKSTVASNLAVALARMGAATGLLDLDFYGPSVTTLFGKWEEPQVVPGGEQVIPSEAHGVRFLSMAQFAPGDQPVMWRGPMLHRMVGQLAAADWGELDYLVLDLPPGTGDVQLTITQTLPLHGAVIVTTPQEIALIDARKGLTMFRDAHVPLLGIVENFSWYDCGKCGKRHALFDEGGGARLAEMHELPLLAQLPLVPEVRIAADAGRPIALDDASPAGQANRDLALRVAAELGTRSLRRNPFRVLS